MLLCTDQNGCRAGSVTETIVEDRSAASELVATPAAAIAIAEANVAGSKQARSTRGGKAGRSAIVYATGTSTDPEYLRVTVRNHCVQSITFGNIREVTERFTMESNIGVCGGKPVFELFDANHITLPDKSEQWAAM